jgi:cytochrome c-type biogenesis protein CcsB
MTKVMLKFLGVLFLCAPAARGQVDDFASRVDVSPLKSIALQHRQTIKTLDSYARQVLTTITGHGSLGGNPAVYTLLDIAARPEDYLDKKIIFIKSVPLRQDFQRLDFISADEQKRILKEGTVSLSFAVKPEVRQLVEEVAASAVFKSRAADQYNSAWMTMAQLCHGPNFPPAAIIGPATSAEDDVKWKRLDEIAGNVPDLQTPGQPVPAKLPGYDDAKLTDVADTVARLLSSWRAQDAGTVNTQIRRLAQLLPEVAPARYPSPLKRGVEVLYNKLYMLTLPASGLYFVAFVCFLMAARSGVAGLRRAGLVLFAIGLLVHTLGIGIRWWLVSVTHGNWFDSIPIKNQFESVLMSAWFGAVVGFSLEMWTGKGRGLFGAAACFVGWMSLTAIFATPYMTGTEIGGEIGQVQGVLMSYWLYIHVTMVVASYSLIGMGFLLSLCWLASYYFEHGTLGRVDLNPATTAASNIDVIDACNLVVLQMAFWVLGTGVVLGAIWADQSWGRPWGWDPKETFALCTWIVYLIVVHVRVATVNKAWWTAVLSVLGFFVMLFNWIGVNFFLVGLHSYA